MRGVFSGHGVIQPMAGKKAVVKSEHFAGVPAWLSWLRVVLLTLAQIMTSQFSRPAPHRALH